jgi:hypothetical protein
MRIVGYVARSLSWKTRSQKSPHDLPQTHINKSNPPAHNFSNVSCNRECRATLHTRVLTWLRLVRVRHRKRRNALTVISRDSRRACLLGLIARWMHFVRQRAHILNGARLSSRTTWKTLHFYTSRHAMAQRTYDVRCSFIRGYSS